MNMRNFRVGVKTLMGLAPRPSEKNPADVLLRTAEIILKSDDDLLKTADVLLKTADVLLKTTDDPLRGSIGSTSRPALS